jgi:hypothetical protein
MSTKHALRDPHTGRFIKNRARKYAEYSYGIGLLKTSIYAVCVMAFFGIIAATILFLQIQTLKRDITVHEATAAKLFDSQEECFTVEEEPSTEVIGVLDSHELLGGNEEPETEKPRPEIRVFRNGVMTLE